MQCIYKHTLLSPFIIMHHINCAIYCWQFWLFSPSSIRRYSPFSSIILFTLALLKTPLTTCRSDSCLKGKKEYWVRERGWSTFPSSAVPVETHSLSYTQTLIIIIFGYFKHRERFMFSFFPERMKWMRVREREEWVTLGDRKERKNIKTSFRGTKLAEWITRSLLDHVVVFFLDSCSVSVLLEPVMFLPSSPFGRRQGYLLVGSVFPFCTKYQRWWWS